MDSKGKIEIVFDDKGVEICIDGLLGACDASLTFGTIMGTILNGASEDVVVNALRVFIEALVDKYKKG